MHHHGNLINAIALLERLNTVLDDGLARQGQELFGQRSPEPLATATGEDYCYV
jgi:hypothetical protein